MLGNLEVEGFDARENVREDLELGEPLLYGRVGGVEVVGLVDGGKGGVPLMEVEEGAGLGGEEGGGRIRGGGAGAEGEDLWPALLGFQEVGEFTENNVAVGFDDEGGAPGALAFR